jgi:hypothetical protein
VSVRIKRREFITLLGGAAGVAPRGARAADAAFGIPSPAQQSRCRITC